MLRNEEKKMFEAVQKRDDKYFEKMPENLNINAQDARGDTLLHKLVKTEFVPQALPHILKRNPNPFVENNDGMTPRMLAVWCGATSQAAFLAAYEASYTEKQRQYQIEWQAKALMHIANVIDDLALSPLHVSTSKIKKIACRIHRDAYGRVD